jgi:hypothetical protein
MIKILLFILIFNLSAAEKVEKSETFIKAEAAEKANKAREANIVKKVAEIQNPSLSLTFGYPYLVIQDNAPKYDKDFLSLGIGALMEFKFDEINAFGIVIDSSFTPQHVDFDFQKESKAVGGTTSLLTSFYSFNYLRRVGITDGYEIIGSIGPAVGIYTLNYTQIDKNDTNISKVNRVRVTNYGVRAGVKWRNRITFNYFEIAAIYSVSDKYSVIDDSTNDAEAIENIENATERKTYGLLFNYGFYLF